MGGTAPADAELLDDADTETAAAAAERSAQQLHLWAFNLSYALTASISSRCCAAPGGKVSVHKCPSCMHLHVLVYCTRSMLVDKQHPVQPLQH